MYGFNNVVVGVSDVIGGTVKCVVKQPLPGRGTKAWA